MTRRDHTPIDVLSVTLVLEMGSWEEASELIRTLGDKFNLRIAEVERNNDDLIPLKEDPAVT